jgi:single-strand DNA-binding protein
MAAVNKVILIGNLGKDPEMRRTQTGSAVTNFSIATTEKFKGKDGVQKEETEWHNIVAWNKAAEVMAQYLKKGSTVYIEGKLRTRDWEDNGVKKYKTEVVVREFQFLGGGKKQDGGQQQQSVDGGGFGEAPQGFDNGQPQQGEW